MLWGKSLIKNHPNLQTDMWDFHGGIHHLFTKMLADVSTTGRRALAAHERLAVAMEEWHKAVVTKQVGGHPGAKWGALGDIGQIMLDHAKILVENNVSSTLQKTNDTAVLWVANDNSNKNVFWMFMQIHA
jgi:hypothetical protein